jgi:hypothetical protein
MFYEDGQWKIYNVSGFKVIALNPDKWISNKKVEADEG